MSVARIRDDQSLTAELERLLPRVEKPTRYVGGEVNSRVKDPADVHTRVALAFPDVYEIGMSHLGFRILYGLLNDLPGVAAERVFMPWVDMLALLRERELPLTTLETRRPLDRFDIVGFSMQYELTVTNVLAMLDLCGIPLWAGERREGDPLVLGGGPVVFNTEPFAPFFDLILVGDAEEALPEMLALHRQMKEAGARRLDIVRAVAKLGGWYAPALYDAVPEPVLGMLVPRPREGEDVPAKVKRRVVYDLDRFPFPAEIVVPHAEIVHDRVSWEIMRGCPVGCRFCQAGYIYRPTRERNPREVAEGVRRSVASTGYDEFSLTSLNTGEYGAIEPLLTRLMDEMEPQSVAVGLSSLHATTLTETLVEQVKRVRKTGFTMAPEAGSQRMRDVINKNLTEDDVLRAARLAFEGGWDLIKLYFMIGLPTETMDDVDALVDLAGKIARMGRQIAGPRCKVTLSASTFIPKVFTPFQWFGMDREADFVAKQRRIRERVPRGVQFKHHDHASSWLEGVLSRADRSVAPAIVAAYRAGAVMDGWTECFDVARWRAAFDACGLDAEALATRPIPLEAELPWEVIDPLIRRRWLEREYKASVEAGTKVPCASDACSGCAPFAKECVKGIIAENRWTDVPGMELPAAPPPSGRTVAGALPGFAGAPPAVAAAPPSLSSAASFGCPGTATALGPESAPGVAEGAGPTGLPADAAAAGNETAEEAAAPAPPEPPTYRYRARFQKLGRSRFLGHLDLVRALAMGLRRAGVPLAYSKGFKPHPRITLSPALGLGIGSNAEYFDVETRAPLELDSAPARLNAALPEGLRVTALVPLDAGGPALQDLIQRAEYRAIVPGLHAADLAERAARFAEREEWVVVRQRKGQERRIDIRPLVEKIGVDEEGALRFTLVLAKEGAAKPSEVVAAIAGAPVEDCEMTRLEQFAARHGRLVSPLLAARTRLEASS